MAYFIRDIWTEYGSICLRPGFIKSMFCIFPKNAVTKYPNRIAFDKLFTGPGLDGFPDSRSLLEVCIAAITRFRPSTFQASCPEPQWTTVEAVFQSEMYHCLFEELSGLHIDSEYAWTRKGRVDFFVPHRHWGIELLRNGSIPQILEHSTRFGPTGKYTSWAKIQDYVIINFCHPGTYRENLYKSGDLTTTFWLTLI